MVLSLPALHVHTYSHIRSSALVSYEDENGKIDLDNGHSHFPLSQLLSTQFFDVVDQVTGLLMHGEVVSEDHVFRSTTPHKPSDQGQSLAQLHSDRSSSILRILTVNSACCHPLQRQHRILRRRAVPPQRVCSLDPSCLGASLPRGIWGIAAAPRLGPPCRNTVERENNHCTVQYWLVFSVPQPFSPVPQLQCHQATGS